jgi:hypothetical protein
MFKFASRNGVEGLSLMNRIGIGLIIVVLLQSLGMNGSLEGKVEAKNLDLGPSSWKQGELEDLTAKDLAADPAKMATLNAKGTMVGGMLGMRAYRSGVEALNRVEMRWTQL